MVVTLTTSGAVVFKAGVDHTVLTDTLYTEAINEAEGEIFADTGVDFVDKYSAINANFKKVLDSACSNKAAIYVINNNIDAIGRGTSTLMTNVLSWAYDKAILRLRLSDIKKEFGVT